MKKLVLLTAVAFLWTARAHADSLKLELHGIHCAGCAGALTESMSKVPSVKVIEKPSKKLLSTTSLTILDIDWGKAELGDLAKAIADTETTHRAKEAPFSFLILDAPSLTRVNVGKLEEALKGVRGIDAKGSKTDLKKKEIHLKLDGRGGAKIADIQKALADYLKKE